MYDVWERLGSLDSGVQQLLASKTDHDKRIRALEAIRNWCGGVVAVVLGGFGLVKVTGHG